MKRGLLLVVLLTAVTGCDKSKWSKEEWAKAFAACGPQLAALSANMSQAAACATPTITTTPPPTPSSSFVSSRAIRLDSGGGRAAFMYETTTSKGTTYRISP